MNEKDFQTLAFFAKVSAVWSLVREVEASYQQQVKTHKEPMTQEELDELLYLTSTSASRLDNIGMDAHKTQEEKVAKLSKKK